MAALALCSGLLAAPLTSAGFALLAARPTELLLAQDAPLRLDEVAAAREAYARARARAPSAERHFDEARLELALARRAGFASAAGRDAAARAEAALIAGIQARPTNGHGWADLAHLLLARPEDEGASRAATDRAANEALMASLAVAPHTPDLLRQRTHLAFHHWERLEEATIAAMRPQYALALRQADLRMTLVDLGRRYRKSALVLETLAEEDRELFLYYGRVARLARARAARKTLEALEAERIAARRGAIMRAREAAGLGDVPEDGAPENGVDEGGGVESGDAGTTRGAGRDGPDGEAASIEPSRGPDAAAPRRAP